jgi:diamine N-acetyltransferase
LIHDQKTISYRAPSESEAAALAELGRTTFVETFGTLYKAEDLSAFLAEAYSETGLLCELQNPSLIFRVAEEGGNGNGRLIGICKLSTQSSLAWQARGRKVLELKQLYLRKTHLGLGIGDAMMTWALAEANAREVDDIILSVYSDNLRAQRFYKRHGFSHAGDTIFMVGNHPDHEFVYHRAIR